MELMSVPTVSKLDYVGILSEMVPSSHLAQESEKLKKDPGKCGTVADLAANPPQ